MSTIYDAQGGRARYIAEAVLFVDSDETWKVGEFGQTISSYKTISYGDTPLSDAIGFVALAVSKSDAGYTLYAMSSDGTRTFYSAAVNSDGVLQNERELSQLDLVRVESELHADLNGNGAIGAGEVLYYDSKDLDIGFTDTGHVFIENSLSMVTPLYFGGRSLTQDMLGTSLEITHVVATTNGYQLYVADFADSNTYKVGFSLEGISATVELLTPEQVRADEAALGVDVNHRTDTPVTEGWTAMIQTQALREQLEQNTASGNKLSYAQVVELVVTAVHSIAPGQAVGDALVSDLRAIAARGDALFGTDAESTSYLSYVFENMVGSTRANNFYTGGATKATPLGNLTAQSDAEHLKKLGFKWLLGLDMPNPTSEGDTANPDATAATGVYKAFEASLFGANGPQFSDVNQGSAGTCYLLAAAAAVAYADPDAIKAIFVTNENLVEGYQTYGVRLYDAYGQARWVTVNNQLAVTDDTATVPLYSKLYSATSPEVTTLWMPLLEKAYAQMNEQGFLSRDPGSNGKNAVWAVEGGMSDAGSFILGQPSYMYSDEVQEEAMFHPFSPLLTVKPTPDGTTQLEAITAYMNGGNALWLGSFGATFDANGSRQFVNGHAYMVMDADPASADNTTVLIYNPWGATPPGAPNGYVAPFAGDLAELVGVEELQFWMYEV